VTGSAVTDGAAVDLLHHLVAIPSPSGQESGASQALVQWMSRFGFAARVDEVGNAVGTRGDGPLELLLLGHIDTFPGEIPVRRDGTVLVGRGTVDAKGPLCAFAVAAARAPVPQGWRWSVVGAVEEEAATSRGAHHVVRLRCGTGGSGPPAVCIIGEPSRWDRLVLGYKGRIVIEVTLRAPFAHSAGAEPLPAERAVALWKAVEGHCRGSAASPGSGREFESLTPSLRAISTADHGAYGEARLSLSVRLPLGVDPATAEQGIVAVMSRDLFGAGTQTETTVEAATRDGVPGRRHLVRAADASGPDGGLELGCVALGQEPAFKAGKSNQLVRAFLAAIRAAEGDPRFVVKTGTSDMNLVGRTWPGIPIVAYGPGDSALDHTPHEHVNLDEYLRAVGVLERVLARM
jgi:LysW-gamma-L-lysine carboxypeptidase